ncbi:TonB protein [Herbaspirillum sp. GW103]|uniref:energy transducer TonB n=1 Tax=unclassified Herbaspirillum TaxID=2624150 RepID=UPI00025E3855|nr:MULTISPECIES: energy transducer TonB [unclassified Herbaspirillum]EIJ48911.1 TonB protein [Herbaspirillum sp. GW103]MCI1005319.1 energy transducer TonB [Herbaspirillum sp. C7C8]NUT59993.1 energy transducer TonB [Herbaspirillum sp. C9C3]
MNAISPSLMSISPPSALMRQARKIGPLGLIILLHIAFFWALQSGLVHQVASAVPKEVIATFIVPEKAPEPAPPKAEPAPPKPVKIVKKVVTPPKPIPVTETPAPTAITAPPQPPQPAAPAPQVAAEPTPAPAAPPGPVLPKQITSGIEYIEKPNPTYPSVSRRMGEEGVVEFRVTVNTSGRAEKVEITKSSGYSRLDDAARNAIMRAVFKPYIENGRAITVSTVGSLAFRLN